jgi:hypothetical protein
MGWIDRQSIPVWHTTGNHTVYNKISEVIFCEALNPPRNGPPEQEGLSYWIRRNDLFMVFINTVWSDLGGEGHVETAWLSAVLEQHADAKYKFVIGHHPASPVNGFSGPYQRHIGPEHVDVFWTCLVDVGVLAYWCSHILAFDVQVHRGYFKFAQQGPVQPTECRMGSSTCIVFRRRSTRRACDIRCSILTALFASGCAGQSIFLRIASGAP